MERVGVMALGAHDDLVAAAGRAGKRCEVGVADEAVHRRERRVGAAERAQALDAAEPDEVTSPTFTLLHEYDGTLDGKPVKLYHIDVYRLEGERQLETLGLDELLTPDALVLVEWGDKFKSIRKKATGEIAISSAGGDARKITVTLRD